jgi:hypothetical protein
MSREAPWDEQIVLDTALAVVERNEVAPATFARKLTEQLDEFEDLDFLVNASDILGQIVSAPSATVHYIADKRVIAPKAEMRRGGTKFYTNRNMPKMRVVEDFGKLGPDFVEVGGDCEDSGNFNGRMFVAIRDGSMTHPLTKALQKLARKYAGAGNLLTVTARNVSDSEHAQAPIGEAVIPGTHKPIGLRIGEPADVNMKPGAHEFLQLIPKRTVYEWAARTSPSDKMTLRWSDGTLMHKIPAHEALLPLVDCEGTGMVRPLILPDEAYRGRKDHKLNAVEKQLKYLDAYTRLVTGRTYKEMYQGAKPANPDPAIFNKYGQFMRVAHKVINDPDTMASDFYRMSRSKFFIPERNDVIYDKIFKQAETDPLRMVGEEIAHLKTPAERGNAFMIGASDPAHGVVGLGGKGGYVSVPVKNPPFYWLDTTPVQVGPRPKKYNEIEEEDGMPASGALTYGVHTTDERNKRKFVGLVRAPMPSNAQFLAIHSIVKHLPPITPMKPMDDVERKHLEDELMPEISKVISDELAKYDKARERAITSRVNTISFFMRTSDYDQEGIGHLARWAGENPHVIYAHAAMEPYAHNLSMIRMDFMIGMQDWKGIEKEKISFIKNSRA